MDFNRCMSKLSKGFKNYSSLPLLSLKKSEHYVRAEGVTKGQKWTLCIVVPMTCITYRNVYSKYDFHKVNMDTLRPLGLTLQSRTNALLPEELWKTWSSQPLGHR